MSQSSRFTLPGGKLAIREPVIQIRNVSKRFLRPRSFREIIRHPFGFQSQSVLSKIDLDIAVHSILGLLGPNGAGKTTLLRILAGTVSPDSGSVTILGQDTLKESQIAKQQIGFVLSDERSFFWRLTARQNLSFFATLSNVNPESQEQRISELAECFDLLSELDKPFRYFSTGMRQRLALARALLHEPQILLVDEPTRGLDPGAAKSVRDLIKNTLCKKLGKTILLATHNLEEAREITDHLALLEKGALVSSGTTPECLPKAHRLFSLEDF